MNKTKYKQFLKAVKKKYNFSDDEMLKVIAKPEDWHKEYHNFLFRKSFFPMFTKCISCGCRPTNFEKLQEFVGEERLAGATEEQKRRCNHYCHECGLEAVFDIIVNQELPLRQFGGISARGEEEWD